LPAVHDHSDASFPDAGPDLAGYLARSKDILTTMANAVSAMKIFPSDHETIRTFVDSLAAKFDGFFQRFARLDVEVGEYTFRCADQVVYTDETTIKSLPFFFHKDGTEILYFYRGLDRPEIRGFLELIKTVSQKPGFENDIVAALWESDFSNIQYYAPDEFLENQIIAEKREVQAAENLPELPSDLAHESVEVKVDRSKFADGRIELKPADREKVARDREAADPDDGPPEMGLPIPFGQAPAASPDESAGAMPLPTIGDKGLTQADLADLETLVRANRDLSPEEEFINLTAEIVFLEADPAICAASLDVLADFHFDQIRAGRFSVGKAVIEKTRELMSHLGPDPARKAGMIEAALKKLMGPKALEAVESALSSDAPVEWASLLAFFRILGKPTLSTAGALFEKRVDPEVRGLILEFIQDLSGHDPAVMISLANDNRPALSTEIIRLLADLPQERGIPHLAAFLMFKSRDLKLETIHALGRLQSEKANRILHGFLNDPDEDLRIQAALKLNPAEERSRIVQFIGEAAAAEFRKKSLKEKSAILSFLGRTRSPEALEFLAAVLARRALWPSGKSVEMKLAAVAGLESMGTAKAAEVLESGARGRGRKVRGACAEALARISAAGIPVD
jgi:HEAT repeat protein